MVNQKIIRSALKLCRTISLHSDSVECLYDLFLKQDDCNLLFLKNIEAFNDLKKVFYHDLSLTHKSRKCQGDNLRDSVTLEVQKVAEWLSVILSRLNETSSDKSPKSVLVSLIFLCEIYSDFYFWWENLRELNYIQNTEGIKNIFLYFLGNIELKISTIYDPISKDLPSIENICLDKSIDSYFRFSQLLLDGYIEQKYIFHSIGCYLHIYNASCLRDISEKLGSNYVFILLGGLPLSLRIDYVIKSKRVDLQMLVLGEILNFPNSHILNCQEREKLSNLLQSLLRTKDELWCLPWPPYIFKEFLILPLCKTLGELFKDRKHYINKFVDYHKIDPLYDNQELQASYKFADLLSQSCEEGIFNKLCSLFFDAWEDGKWEDIIFSDDRLHLHLTNIDCFICKHLLLLEYCSLEKSINKTLDCLDQLQFEWFSDKRKLSNAISRKVYRLLIYSWAYGQTRNDHALAESELLGDYFIRKFWIYTSVDTESLFSRRNEIFKYLGWSDLEGIRNESP